MIEMYFHLPKHTEDDYPRIYLKNFNQILVKDWSEQMYEWQFQEVSWDFTSIRDKRLLIWE